MSHPSPKTLRFAALCFAAPFLASCVLPLGARQAPAHEEKSVLTGELLAVFPGFFIHGMGHRYAGNDERANELLAMEGYSLLTAGLGGGLYALGVSEDAEAVEVAGLIGMGVGALLFVGTWIYDIAFTPSEVKEHNLRPDGVE